jgi:serine protease Do
MARPAAALSHRAANLFAQRQQPSPMKLTSLRSNLRSSRVLLLMLAVGAPLTACGRDATRSTTDPLPSQHQDRPPLQLHVDRKPIDRNAPDRVSYAPVVEKSSSSVVFVYSTRQVRTPRELAPFLNDPTLRRFFDIPGHGQLPDRTQQGLGSGVIVSRDGYILTNNHVIEGADEVKVSIGEALRRYDATVVGTDALADLAVLKIDADDLTPAVFGDSEQLMVGDVVLAMGNPFGVGLSVSRGIVSGVSRGMGMEQIEDFIQTDASINMGNSGGPLLDSEGRVIGINTAILSRSGGFAGVGFAIPINLARHVAEQIVNTGEVRRGFLGVAPQPLTPELAAHFGAERGALVAEVTPGGPADKAGLRPGDVITKVNDAEVADARELLLAVSQLEPGSQAAIEYQRNGRTRTAKATLVQRPDTTVAGLQPQPGAVEDTGVLEGVGVADLTPQIRSELQIPARVEGAIITQIDPASPSARQGLQEGDVILELDRRPVRNAEEAVELSEQIEGPKVMVRIWRDGRSRYLVIDESTG